MESFEYKQAIEELEKIVTLVEDPSTGIDDIDKYIIRSNELIAACRAYLRTSGDRLEQLSTRLDQ